MLYLFFFFTRMMKAFMNDQCYIPQEWLCFVPALKAGKHVPLLNTITALRHNGKKIYPRQENIFQALHYAKPEEIKVIILGQDPYHGPEQAHGLAFSVPEHMTAPPSLRNIFKEISQDEHLQSSILIQEKQCYQQRLSPNLVRWAKQGVLLLNDILSVEHGKALSHEKLGWQIITQDILKALAQNKLQNTKPQPLAALLWGNAARKHAKLFLQEQVHLVLEAPHPSPLSAFRGFLGCGHFSAVNTWLLAQGQKPIVW